MTHLSPEALAGYLDDDLSRDERTQAELHLAACAECREELAEVRRLQSHGSRKWAFVLIPAGVAAAVVALTTVLPRQASAPSEIRARSDADARLGVVSPLSGAEIPPGPITFLWKSAGPGASYTVTLQDADGRVVWTATVDDTVAVLPESVAPGGRSTRFWTVDALLPDGRALSTGVLRLRIGP